jgi:hypothetical protein
LCRHVAALLSAVLVSLGLVVAGGAGASAAGRQRLLSELHFAFFLKQRVSNCARTQTSQSVLDVGTILPD